jgi:hypothetical protein
VNGEPATLVALPPTTSPRDRPTVPQPYRIDLVLARSSLDSDGDGLPDWWEDQTGTDKWNPNDGPASALIGGAARRSANDFTGHTFAEWRQHYFPERHGRSSRPLHSRTQMGMASQSLLEMRLRS